MINHDELITISTKEYNEMSRECEFLDCLRAARVDNWEGYSDAWQMFKELEVE